ncbi:MAG TPA: hypothetical protein ENJ79_00140 [Gammaproteobacteria bacterium]|nr:hypothetical protein [Gammaproteobacteria bacterium]
MGNIHRILQVLCLFLPCAAFAGADRPQHVQDLHYGEVLFHFYQDDYFTAITHLMAAQADGRLPHHRDEAELLLGGLQLSYGMLDEAEQRFKRLLTEDTNPELRNRAWYYLARIAYQYGQLQKSLQALNRIDAPKNPRLRAETALLTANVYMALGEDERAAELLAETRAPTGLREYLRINQGIAELRAGDIDAGTATLDRMGKDDVQDEELAALRDRANLALGYQLLREDEGKAARKYLDRVRLRGPYMAAALLGAGWADAARGNFESALTPWFKLLQLDSRQIAAHEVRLAVPYSFTLLGDHDRAIYFYEQAIAYYDDEESRLHAAMRDVDAGALTSLLQQADTLQSGGWLHEVEHLENIPSGDYLVDVLSGHAFQEALKDYRDLGFLQQLLERRLNDIELFHAMVEARRLAYAERAPRIRERLARAEAAGLDARWQKLHTLLEHLDQNPDPLALATSGEKQLLALSQRIDQALEQLPQDHPRRARLADRARWLRGVLHWNIQSETPQRQRVIDKAMHEIRPAVDEALARHHKLGQALQKVPRSFKGFDARIEALRQRIVALLPGIRLARTRAGGRIHDLAMQELRARVQRLVDYRAQARYALARNYDKLAEREARRAKP